MNWSNYDSWKTNDEQAEEWAKNNDCDKDAKKSKRYTFIENDYEPFEE